MLAVADAQKIVLEQARPLPPASASLDASALGLVLAEDIASDIDSPPHDKATVDGYAVVAADLASGTAELQVLEELLRSYPRVALVAAAGDHASRRPFWRQCRSRSSSRRRSPRRLPHQFPKRPRRLRRPIRWLHC